MNQPQIKIDSPCPMQLLRMQKNKDGYYCKSCSKTVIDFRNQSNEAINSQISDSTCGIFYEDQLKSKPIFSFKNQFLFIALSFFSLLGFSLQPLKASSQDTMIIAKKQIEKTDTTEVSKNDHAGLRIFRAQVARFFHVRRHRLMGCPKF